MSGYFVKIFYIIVKFSCKDKKYIFSQNCMEHLISWNSSRRKKPKPLFLPVILQEGGFTIFLERGNHTLCRKVELTVLVELT
jgi:hypothetical protein